MGDDVLIASRVLMKECQLGHVSATTSTIRDVVVTVVVIAGCGYRCRCV